MREARRAKGDRIRRDDELGAVLFRNLSDLRGLALEEAEVRGILDVDGGRLFRDLLLQVVEVQEPGLLIEPHGDDREVRLQVVGDDEERLRAHRLWDENLVAAVDPGGHAHRRRRGLQAVIEWTTEDIHVQQLGHEAAVLEESLPLPVVRVGLADVRRQEFLRAR